MAALAEPRAVAQDVGAVDRQLVREPGTNMRLPRDTPKYEDLVYDIGMHKGEDSEFYLRKGFRVVAFEADPDLVNSCKTRLQSFLDRGQLTIVEGAIVDPVLMSTGAKTVRFFKNDDVSLWGTISENWAERNARLGCPSRPIVVDAVDLAAVMQEHGVPHYMKTDIEGSDAVCLNVLRAFAERPDYVSLESDKRSLANIAREIDTLVDLGYESFQAVEQSAVPLAQSPPHPPTEGAYVAQQFDAGASGLFGSELGERWKSKPQILRQYRAIRLGYWLLGDDGIMTAWKWRGAGGLRLLTRNALSLWMRAAVPGWYDTHARHESVGATRVSTRAG